MKVELEIVCLNAQDVITASGCPCDGATGGMKDDSI